MSDNSTYRVVDIIRGTSVDGPGLRTSIYLAGCRHNCEGCHNPQSHDPHAGSEMTLSEIMQIVEEEDFNVTLSGGDPLYDPLHLIPLVKAIKGNRRNLWIYTGYTWEEICSSTLLFNAVKDADVVVDGPFLIFQRNPDLRFRGSENQRLIDVKKSIETGEAILFVD